MIARLPTHCDKSRKHNRLHTDVRAKPFSWLHWGALIAQSQSHPVRRASLREWLEYLGLRLIVAVLKWLPRSISRIKGATIGALAWHFIGRLRRIGLRNLSLAFPDMPAAERERILRMVYRLLGWQMAEFCRMPRASRANAQEFFRYEGLEHYLAARNRGNGVLVLTGHLGAWELSSFYHSLMGYPMSMVIRPCLDNPSSSTPSSTASAASTATASSTRTTSPAVVSSRPCTAATPSAITSWTPT